MDKPLHHQTLIVRLSEPRVHTNADSLELFDIPETAYQVVTKKGAFKAGDLGVYIFPDSVVPQTAPFKWLWEAYVGTDGFVPAKRRRITVRKFRGEWSEGLLMPISDFFPTQEWADDKSDASARISAVREGADVSDLLGITHYEPEEEAGHEGCAPKRKKRYPKTVKGWAKFFWYRVLHILYIKRDASSQAMDAPIDAPNYDVVALKASRAGFPEGTLFIATEKLHGANGRFVFLDGVMYAGSHFQWKAPGTANIFNRVLTQQPWIEEWCRVNEGFVLYGEVVGDQKGYTYGLDKSKGELAFYAFDIRTPDGRWEKPFESDLCHDGQTVNVPILYAGTDMNVIKACYVDGKSAIDSKTQREGVVISAIGECRQRQYKIVSNVFLSEDSK